MIRTTEVSKGEAIVAALRSVADFFARHPDLAERAYLPGLQIGCNTKDEIVALARLFAREFERADKKTGGGFFFVEAYISLDPKVYLYGGVPQEKVCRRIVKGTERVPAQDEYEREVVEWVCDDALLANGHKDPA